MMEEHPKIEFLKGKRVTLRPVLKEDIPHFLRWINDPEVTQFLTLYLPMMEVDEEEWFASLPKRKQTDLVFTLVTPDGQPIGAMGLHRINWKDRVATTGTIIGEKDYWGKGYGTEAKMLLLYYAFERLNLRKVCSEVLAFNNRSQAYLVKCGYVEEGRRRREHYHNGRYWDIMLMAVFRDQWRPLWRGYRDKHLQ